MSFLSALFGVESKARNKPRRVNTMTATKQAASVRLSARMNSAITEQAKQLKISKDALVRRAIVGMLEEIEDLKTVEARRGEKSVPWSRVKAELGL